MAEPVIIQRPAAVQAGVTAYLEKHKQELRRIHALNSDEQEQELSVLMNRELGRIAKMEPHDPEKELATQVVIALETDRILGLNSERQQKVIAEKYGLDPKAVIDHYPELQAKSVELRQKLDAAERNRTVMGWTGFFGTLAATLIPFGNPKRSIGGSIGDRFSIDNKLIKGFFVALAALAIGFGASFAGSRFFGRKVKEDSKALVTESRVVFEREIADAIGHKVRESVALAVASQTPAAPAFKDSIQPREGFAAEVAKEKAAAQAAGTAIG